MRLSTIGYMNTAWRLTLQENKQVLKSLQGMLLINFIQTPDRLLCEDEKLLEGTEEEKERASNNSPIAILCDFKVWLNHQVLGLNNLMLGTARNFCF